jgi:hypothetical protein
LLFKVAMGEFQQRLKNFKQQLRHWNKEVFGNIFQEKKALEQRLEDIQQEVILSGHMEAQQQEEECLKKQLEE